MKTKMNRRETSLKRQEVARQLRVWKQKIKELEHKLLVDPQSSSLEQLVLCRSELDICSDRLRKLNTKQRTWASGTRGIQNGSDEVT